MDEDTFREYRWLKTCCVNEYIRNRSTVILLKDNKTQKGPNIHTFCPYYILVWEWDKLNIMRVPPTLRYNKIELCFSLFKLGWKLSNWPSIHQYFVPSLTDSIIPIYRHEYEKDKSRLFFLRIREWLLAPRFPLMQLTTSHFTPLNS